MALQSSGQISLSNIASEFGGSAPHALSEYYGSDTVPSSGQISFSNFYGTSSITYLAQSNVGSGTFTTKASPTHTQRYGYSDGVVSPAMGSMTNTSVSNSGVYIRQVTNMTGFQPVTTLRFSGNYTAWTTLVLNNGTSLNRTAASVYNGTSEYRWSRSQGGFSSMYII